MGWSNTQVFLPQAWGKGEGMARKSASTKKATRRARRPDVSKPKTDAITARCTQIADEVVPEYRGSERSYSCAGTVAKRWQAAWDGACVALGHAPESSRSAVTGKQEHKNFAEMTVCQHFVSGSQATGVHKGACSKRATSRVNNLVMYDLVNPAVCGHHGLFWKRRGYQVIALALEPA
jgi:hypothetical protein